MQLTNQKGFGMAQSYDLFDSETSRFVDANDGSLCLVTELCEGGNLQEVRFLSQVQLIGNHFDVLQALIFYKGRIPPALLKQAFKQVTSV
jgi:hypothetical protein